MYEIEGPPGVGGHEDVHFYRLEADRVSLAPQRLNTGYILWGLNQSRVDQEAKRLRCLAHV